MAKCDADTVERWVHYRVSVSGLLVPIFSGAFIKARTFR